MSSKKPKFYSVKILDWVLFDPKFSKNYKQYFPLDAVFLNSKEFDSLSPASTKLLLFLLKLTQRYSKADVELSESCFKANGKLTESLLDELQRNQILSYSLINKEINKLINKEAEKNNKDFLDQNSKEFILYFQNFVTNEMGSLDTGFISGYGEKTFKTFGTIEGFKEFVDQVTGSKKFKEIEFKNQLSYFKKALKDEIAARSAK